MHPTPLRAYPLGQSQKEKLVNDAIMHRKADEYIKGRYWSAGKGCSIGCITKDPSGNHQAVTDEFYIALPVVYLADKIFEGLPEPEHKTWTERWTNAVKVNSDTSMIASQMMVYVLSDEKYGCRQYANEDGQKAIDAVVSLYKSRLEGKEATDKEWQAAARVAREAAGAAVYRAQAEHLIKLLEQAPVLA